MDYSKKQSQLDVKKWVESEIKGCDTCGTYSYCSSCNKDEAYPCACAYEKYSAITKLAKETKSTSSAKKATTTKTTTAKKTTCSKSTTAKKTTTKKTAKVAA